MTTATVFMDIPALLTKDKDFWGTGPVGLPQGLTVELIGRPFWNGGEHWHRIRVDGVTIIVPDVFLSGARD